MGVGLVIVSVGGGAPGDPSPCQVLELLSFLPGKHKHKLSACLSEVHDTVLSAPSEEGCVHDQCVTCSYANYTKVIIYEKGEREFS